MRLTEKLGDLTSSIPAEFSSQLLSISDPEKLQDKIAEIIARQGKQQAQLETAANLGQGIDQSNNVMTGLAQMFFGDLGDLMAREMRTVFAGAKGAVAFDRLVADMKKGLDFKELAVASLDAADAANLAAMGNEEFVSELGKTYGANQELQMVLRDLSNAELSMFRESLMESARAAQRHAEAMDRIQRVQEETAAREGIGQLQREINILGKNVEMELNIPWWRNKQFNVVVAPGLFTHNRLSHRGY